MINLKFGPYTYIVRMVILGLLMLSLSRILLIIWQFDRVAETEALFDILIQGIRADIILLSMGASLPALLGLVWANRFLYSSWFKFSFWWCLSWLSFALFLELSTPSFIMQFDIRPDRLYIEYLKYPKEVFSTLWHGFKLSLILGVILHISITYGLFKLLKVETTKNDAFPLWKHFLIWPLVAFLIFAGIRSTAQHRPANPAMFAITSDSLVNSLVINSAYSVLFAIYNLKHEANSTGIYGHLDNDEMIEITRDWPWLNNYSYPNADYPTLHWQEAVAKREKPLNIVIVLQESMGASFVESLGGIPVTPELEKLKHEGMWLENLFATGTRSVRGIEAVIASFMPTPAQSTVKLSLSQNNFTTIASVLKEQGYNTSFMYGGEAHFDNMRTFFTGNGITDIIDLSTIKKEDDNGLFVGSWGASDEDLFEQAERSLKKYSQQNEPFFSLIFTSSNHEPYEFPDDRIDLYSKPKASVNNAVKYADWAMGRFFENIKQENYWQDTVFLIVADHDARAYGSNLIPFENFKIPGLILGADIQPSKIKTITSQIDLAPTLLSLAGVSSCHMLDGRDLALDATSDGRALVQFGNIFALMEEDRVTILQPNKVKKEGHYIDANKKLILTDTEVSDANYKKALAHVQLPSYLYREQRYRNTVTCPAP